jgi:hypothetical protein
MGHAEVLSHGLPRDLREVFVLEIEKRAFLSLADVLVELGFDPVDGGVLQMMAHAAEVAVVTLSILLGDGHKLRVFQRCLEGFEPRSL